MSGIEEHYIIACDVEAGLVYHEGCVNVGDQFTILNGYKLGANTNITVSSSAEDASNSENILQTLVFHTSCSQPLKLLDRYGSVQVIVYANDLQDTVNSFVEVTISYTISNPNEVDISLANLFSNTSFPNAYTGVCDLDGVVLMPDEEFPLEDISFIDLSIDQRYTVIGSVEAGYTSSGFQECRGTASLEIVVGA